MAGCGEPEATGDAPVRPAKLVEVGAVENLRTISLPAVVEALSSVELGFQMAGQVVAVDVREGERIAQGAEIARLDQRELDLELAKAQANHDAAEADLQRAERLAGAGNISESSYEETKTRRDLALVALNGARQRLDDSGLRAPFAALVADVHVEAFQNVAPRQTVVTLQTGGVMAAVVQVPSTLVARSNRFEPLGTVMVLDSAPDRPIAAEFRSFAMRADPARQTFEVRFAFAPPEDPRILPGMTGTLRGTVTAVGNRAVTVPLEAVFSEADARYVWVVDVESMTVSKREVLIGAGVGSTLSVDAGLTPGETIVAAGVSQFHEGMRIRRYEP